MDFHTPILCDRRIYDKKGSWKNPQQDLHDNIFYFIKENPTIVSRYSSGREELVETMTICVYGEKPIAIDDDIVLDNGKTLKVKQIVLHYIEPNILIRDMVKPRVECMDLFLE